MARDFNEKLSAKQTAFNQAGALTVAMINAGLVADKEEAKATMDEFATSIFASLEPLTGASDAPVRQAPPSDPGDYVFTSGKHDGKTIRQIAESSPDYLDWYAANVKKGDAVEQVQKFLNSARAGV